MKQPFRIILAIVGTVLVAACSSSQPAVDQSVLLAYCKEPNDANLENLSKNYSSIINKTRKTGLKQPGIYSDYAVALVKQGRRAEANTWFNKEMAEFVSSKDYVMQLKRTLLPEFVNDNTINENLTNEDSDTVLPPEKRAAAEKRAASVIGDDGGEAEPSKPEENEPNQNND